MIRTSHFHTRKKEEGQRKFLMCVVHIWGKSIVNKRWGKNPPLPKKKRKKKKKLSHARQINNKPTLAAPTYRSDMHKMLSWTNMHNGCEWDDDAWCWNCNKEGEELQWNMLPIPKIDYVIIPIRIRMYVMYGIYVQYIGMYIHKFLPTVFSSTQLRKNPLYVQCLRALCIKYI